MHVLHRCLWTTELSKKKVEVICIGAHWKQILPFLCFVEPSRGPRLSWKKQYFDSKYFHRYLVDCFLLALGRRKHASARDCRLCCAARSWVPKRDPFFLRFAAAVAEVCMCKTCKTPCSEEEKHSRRFCLANHHQSVYISTSSLFKWPAKNPLLVYSTGLGRKSEIRAHRVDDGKMGNNGKMVRLFKSLKVWKQNL